MVDNTPLYNLKAVTNEVGINPVTLRAWERRYDLLKPKRSPGGHRLYSRQDIEMLKWLIERQAEGLSISSAIEMWKNQHQDDLGSLQLVHIPVYKISTGESTLDILRTRWIVACLAFDDLRANRILDEAFAVADPEMIIREVIQKGLVRIGEEWFSGSVSVQQEHFASAIAVQRINVLLAAVAPPTRPGQILVACPPGEEHDFILLFITYLLRRRGWDVVYLGSNVPLIDLDTTIRSTSPILFLSGAQTLITAASLRAMSEYLITQSVPLAYGGGIFNQVPAATKCISGYFLGTDVESVPQTIERLISAHLPMPAAQPVPLQYTQILTEYLQNEWAIITHLSASFRSELVKPAQLDNANENLNQSVVSALAMGDINLLDHFIFWLTGILKTYGLSASLVKEYFTTYRLEVEHYLGDDALIIVNQLAKCETSL